MFCAREGQGRPGPVKKMRWADLTDITLAVLVSPFVWLLVTRAPVLATIVFSSVLITA
jgi:hypothetical protein